MLVHHVPTITAGDADGWCQKWLVWEAPQSTCYTLNSIASTSIVPFTCPLQLHVAAWPMQLVVRKCLNGSFWLSIAKFYNAFFGESSTKYLWLTTNMMYSCIFLAMSCNNRVAKDGYKRQYFFWCIDANTIIPLLRHVSIMLGHLYHPSRFWLPTTYCCMLSMLTLNFLSNWKWPTKEKDTHIWQG